MYRQTHKIKFRDQSNLTSILIKFSYLVNCFKYLLDTVQVNWSVVSNISSLINTKITYIYIYIPIYNTYVTIVKYFWI